MTQVVIVGAGPAGATLALLLAQRGISVQLVEASRTLRRSFRGEGLMPSGLDALQQMGLLPLVDRLPHRPLNAWEFIINRRRLFRVEEPIERDGPPCTLVSQPALLEALIQEASAFPHFEFMPATLVQDLVWQEQRVAGVKLEGRTLPADLVIGTDGRNSIVRQRANLSLQSPPGTAHQFNILWFKLADSPELEAKTGAENIFYSIVQGSHAFGLFRGSEGNLQIGWALRDTETTNWKQLNWVEQLAEVSPPWLADHIRSHSDTLEGPVLLTVVVGRCPQWSVSGVLLLGDAAHPMSPIRAQGINVALRDVIVAANHLVTPLQQGDLGAIDAALPRIQAEREPEIIRAQQLQAQEAAQADLLGKAELLPWIVSQLAPLLHHPIRLAWLRRQRQLRQGVTQVQLRV
jgi:2-polyprenyl-6-methoxyphenol hydroxylase-like FAD-dependent oxidoreductase